MDAQTAAKEAQAAADAAAEELAVYRAEVASAAEAAEQKATAELAELKEQLEQAKRAGSPVRAGVHGGVGDDGVVRGGGSRNGGGNGDSSGDGKETDVSKIPSRPQGVHLPPNPNATNNLAQANPTHGGDLTRVAEAYPQQNNRRFGSTVPGVAFQFGFRLLVTGEAPGYAQQQALLSWMLLLLGSFVVFCLLVF